MSSPLADVRLFSTALPAPQFSLLLRTLPLRQFAKLAAEGLRFYRTTFWYPLSRAPCNVFEQVVDALRPAAAPGPQVVGVEWWFSVTHTNATPQWLLPCHFDRADLEEKDLSRIRHPLLASVLFLNAVPYGELVVTDQVLTERGARPRQPQQMQFIRPRRNLYAVFPGHLHHGVIGRMWRTPRAPRLRVTMAVNWWTEPPSAGYLCDSREAPAVFGAAA